MGEAGHAVAGSGSDIKMLLFFKFFLHVAAGVYVTPLRMLEIAAQVVN